MDKQYINHKLLKRLEWHVTHAYKLVDDSPALAKSQMEKALKDLRNLTVKPTETAPRPSVPMVKGLGPQLPYLGD